jgi:hypothetical protein
LKLYPNEACGLQAEKPEEVNAGLAAGSAQTVTGNQTGIHVCSFLKTFFRRLKV